MCYIKGGILNNEWNNNLTENCFNDNPKKIPFL